MTILNNDIKSYLEKLKSKSATPGGGSVSAITAMQGVALNLMVIELTIGKKGYEQHQEFLIKEKAKNERLYQECLKAADKDIEAYNGFLEAYRLPKDTEDEKKAREKAINKATINAIMSPIYTMELCKSGVGYISEILFKTNKMAISDLISAAIMFEASCKSTSLNVKINAKFLQNRKEAEKFLSMADNLIVDVSKIVGEILEIAVPRL